MDGVVDQIKQKLDIVEVLGEYIRLAKAGRNWKARCPFHSERTPSFMVSQERQIWHCFGCGLGGDIFAFVKQIEGVEFADALRILARRAGVLLKKQDPQVQSQKKRLYEICELAAKFYSVQLEKSLPGKKAGKYLSERGLKTQTIKNWRLGFAPDDSRALSDFLKSRGYNDEEIFQAGLTVKPETTETKTINYKLKTNYDRFRSRIMFPIFDIAGQVVGFAGRIFGTKQEDIGKYINTPQTELYNKSQILYGLNFAKTELRQKNVCIFVEGNLDVIMSHQAGVKNTVASSGTALTDDHLKIIKRYTDNILFAFDADQAGQNATRRSIELALTHDFLIKVILMKDKDPANIIKKNPDEWEGSISQAKSIMDFYFSNTLSQFTNQTQEGRRGIKKMLLPFIKAIVGKTEQSEWLRELGRILKADEKDLMADLQKIKLSPDSYKAQSQETDSDATISEPKTRLDCLEERFLGLCLNNPGHVQNITDICETDFQNEKLGQIFCALKKLPELEDSQNTISHLNKLLPAELKIQMEYLSLKIEQEPVGDIEIPEEIETCKKELKRCRIKQQLLSLSYEIKNIQASGKKVEIKNLLEKFSQLSSQLKSL